MIDPLNPDTDGDQLRDGQEVAGWKVATWREVTMDAIANWSVVSYPWDDDSEDDNSSDFVEFQNGSDPFLEDTDGDGISDYDEAFNNPGANVTGWYNKPPEIHNWKITKYKEGGSLPLVGNGHWVVQVEFDAWSMRGIGLWEVVWGAPKLNATDQAELDAFLEAHGSDVMASCSGSILGGDSSLCDEMKEILSRGPVDGWMKSADAHGNKTAHIVAKFNASVEEVHLNGKWVEARVYGLYGEGVSKKVKVESTLEAVLDVVAAIARAVVEAASYLASLIISAVEWLVDSVLGLFEPAIREFAHAFHSTFPLGLAVAGLDFVLVVGAILGSIILGVSALFGWTIQAIEFLLVIVAFTFPGSQAIITFIAKLLGAIVRAEQILLGGLTRFVDSDAFGGVILYILLPLLFGWGLGEATSALGSTSNEMELMGRVLELLLAGIALSMVAAEWAAEARVIGPLDVIGVGFAFTALIMVSLLHVFEEEGWSRMDAVLLAVMLGVGGWLLGFVGMLTDSLPFEVGLIDEAVSLFFMAATLAVAHREGLF